MPSWSVSTYPVGTPPRVSRTKNSHATVVLPTPGGPYSHSTGSAPAHPVSSTATSISTAVQPVDRYQEDATGPTRSHTERNPEAVQTRETPTYRGGPKISCSTVVLSTRR